MSIDVQCQAVMMTPRAPGAIAILQIHGDVVPLLRALTSVEDWPVGRLLLVSMDGIDEGLVVRLMDDVAQLMPHGGLRVVQRMMTRLRELGVDSCMPELIDPCVLYPEADDEIEARMLLSLSRAASPLAIEPLIAQPEIWRRVKNTAITDEERERSLRLNRVLTPPLVVLAGPPNVGKSTLSNALLGRSMSIAVDMTGTTRDYTTALIELNGLVVQWHDTPGIRESDDPIEMNAIKIAQRLIQRADLLIAMTDAEHDWLTPHLLGRKPDLRIGNKVDIARRDDADLDISAMTGAGVPELVKCVRDQLVPTEDIHAAMNSRWIFNSELVHLHHKMV